MTKNALIFRKSVEKDLRKVPRDLIPAVFEHIEKLASDPLTPESHKLAGAENLYRIRVGDYRIIYQVLYDSHEVIVIYIRHRSTAYRGL